MKDRFYDIISILTARERKFFYWLVWLDLLTSILDIIFLIALLYVVGFYTNTYHSKELFFIDISFFEQYPLLLISCFFILFSLKNALGYGVTRLQFRFVYKVASRISEDNLRLYLQSDYLDYVSVDSSVHIRQVSQQPVEFSHYVLRGLQVIISNLVLLILVIIPIFLFSWKMALLLFLVLVPPVLLTIFFTRKKLSRIRASGKQTREKSIQHLKEALEGFIEVNLYQQKSYFTRRYARFQAEFNDSLAELQVVQQLPSKLMEVFAVFGLFMLVTATTLFNMTAIHVLLIGGFMAAAYKIIPGVVKILNAWEQIKTYGFTVEDLKKKTFRGDEERGMESGLNSIECKGLDFSYQDNPVLKNQSFIIRSGEFIGLKGLSGAGKTSLLHILLGFLKPAKGEILFNNITVNEYERKNYWNRISYSRQQPFFIHESVETNILFGHAKQEDKFRKLVNITGTDQFVNSYPEGFGFLLSEGAKNISGGQRQRILLARTLYKDADLYILDEPFNELDRESANTLLIYLQELASAGKMVLMVTHDEESLGFCSKIISLNEK